MPNKSNKSIWNLDWLIDYRLATREQHFSCIQDENEFYNIFKKNYAEMRERKTNEEKDLWLPNFEMEQFDNYVSV